MLAVILDQIRKIELDPSKGQNRRKQNAETHFTCGYGGFVIEIVAKIGKERPCRKACRPEGYRGATEAFLEGDIQDSCAESGVNDWTGFLLVFDPIETDILWHSLYAMITITVHVRVCTLSKGVQPWLQPQPTNIKKG
jgi:hypothetical protein